MTHVAFSLPQRVFGIVFVAECIATFVGFSEVPSSMLFLLHIFSSNPHIAFVPPL
jgi:hypothetical protein